MAIENTITLALSAVSVALLIFVLLKILRAPKQESPVVALQPVLNSLREGIDSIGMRMSEISKPPVIEAKLPAEGPSGPPGRGEVNLDDIFKPKPGGDEVPPDYGALKPGTTYKYVYDPVTRKNKLVPS